MRSDDESRGSQAAQLQLQELSGCSAALSLASSGGSVVSGPIKLLESERSCLSCSFEQMDRQEQQRAQRQRELREADSAGDATKDRPGRQRGLFGSPSRGGGAASSSPAPASASVKRARAPSPRDTASGSSRRSSSTNSSGSSSSDADGEESSQKHHEVSEKGALVGSASRGRMNCAESSDSTAAAGGGLGESSPRRATPGGRIVFSNTAL